MVRYNNRDAGMRKGQGGKFLLKGTDKILTMLKFLPRNLPIVCSS